MTTHSSTTHDLAQRKVQFDWSQTPLHWIPGDASASHLVNEINLILPAGEFWFCKVFNRARPLITDDKLSEDVKGFVGQEAMHARAHDSATVEYLQASGIETSGHIRRVQWLFDKPLGDSPWGVSLPEFLQRPWLVLRLGAIAAIEHFTCVMGKFALENSAWEAAGADANMVDLLRWHGAEEVEHRCVAFDLYRHLCRLPAPLRYLLDMLLIMLVVPVMLFIWNSGAAYMMRQDPQLRSYHPSVWRPWIWREWRRAAAAGFIPSVGWLLWQALRYLRPGYHPTDEADTEPALLYLASSPATLRAESV
ncbi:metal-dependent hydrolase [Spongiibacter sp.]|uniref:metal-dependent hydrolase n=1 Tax=Spongiibacter sp. TaxID=2024860 RepID=UPI0035617611